MGLLPMEGLMGFSIHNIYRMIFRIWRKRRFEWFINCIKPGPEDVILDVGGYPSTWTGCPPCWARVETLNIHPVEWDEASARKYRIETVVGDGCCLPCGDQSYDIVFSNSVIEHVGDFEKQRAFAAEVRRVGRKLWIQTPAWECPIEPHYLAPFIHYLSRSVRKKIVRWVTPWGLIQKPTQQEVDAMVDGIRLLQKKEMEALFPDCQIITEYLFGVIPKSYIAVRTEVPAPSGCPVQADRGQS